MSMSMYRPRGSFARAIYNKIQKDHILTAMDKQKWYELTTEMHVEDLGHKFMQLSYDVETKDFVETCIEVSDNICFQIWLSLATSLLSMFLSQTTVNGLLGRGSMLVYSSRQFKKLVGIHDEGQIFNKLLDIGAGDGTTTLKMNSYFNEVFVTEMSTTMKWRLQKKGFRILEEMAWSDSNLQFNVVTCLNVLDRCSKPLSLLKEIGNATSSNYDSLVVIAIVLPYKPFVEFDSKQNNEPDELLKIEGETFEDQAASFVQNVLKPNGWDVLRWTKLPYLCEGDINQAYYWLEDAVFVMKKAYGSY